MAKRTEWVGLGEAADMLGVHPTTVRAWADKGEIPSRRTPGGHRRFRRADLESFQRASDPAAEPAETQVMIQSALGRARMQIGGGQLDDLPWYRHLDDEARQFHRRMGRELLTLLTRYLTEPDHQPDALAQVASIGHEYGAMALAQNLKLSEATQALLFFRDVLTDSAMQLAETLHPHNAQEWGDNLRDVNHFTDAVLVALVESYEAQQD